VAGLTGLAWTESFLCTSWGEGGGTGLALIVVAAVVAALNKKRRLLPLAEFEKRGTAGLG